MYIVHVVQKKATLVYKLEAVLRASHYQLYVQFVVKTEFTAGVRAANHSSSRLLHYRARFG